MRIRDFRDKNVQIVSIIDDNIDFYRMVHILSRLAFDVVHFESGTRLVVVNCTESIARQISLYKHVKIIECTTIQKYRGDVGSYA